MDTRLPSLCCSLVALSDCGGARLVGCGSVEPWWLRHSQVGAVAAFWSSAGSLSIRRYRLLDTTPLPCDIQGLWLSLYASVGSRLPVRVESRTVKDLSFCEVRWGGSPAVRR